jgi:hypothetical protein
MIFLIGDLVTRKDDGACAVVTEVSNSKCLIDTPNGSTQYSLHLLYGATGKVAWYNADELELSERHNMFKERLPRVGHYNDVVLAVQRGDV